VKGVERWAGNEGGLVFDPELADRIEGICENDALDYLETNRLLDQDEELTLFPIRT
jgi:hypothetical protein